jgi:hypothetical protein
MNEVRVHDRDVQDDVITPLQFFVLPEDSLEHSPEKKLCFALLEDAWRCLQRFLYRHAQRLATVAEKEEADVAVSWISGEVECGEGGCLPYEACCYALGLDPSYVQSIFRQGLRSIIVANPQPYRKRFDGIWAGMNTRIIREKYQYGHVR